MQAARMAPAYALISILSATVGIALLWPTFGWWSLASIWPVGCGSCLVAGAMVAILRGRTGAADLDHLADDMVADLRGVLATSSRPFRDDEAEREAQRYGSAG